MIKGLFKCYNRTYKDEYLNVFERYDRNIHIIMSYIRGFDMDFIKLDVYTVSILKMLILVDTPINKELTKRIFERINHLPFDFVSNIFFEKINHLQKKGIIEIDKENNINLNKKIVTQYTITISLIDRLTISREIINEFEAYKERLSIPLLKFAIQNLDKDYNRRKSYILLLIDYQQKSGRIEQEYLDMLFYLDDINDLIRTCSIYYNLQVYDVPLYRIIQHSQYNNDRRIQILKALLHERLHEGDYCQELKLLLESSKNIDERCLLLAILFTAQFNSGKNYESRCVLDDVNNELYYKNFAGSRYYPFLLRNISYYIEDVECGIRNYNLCLNKFRNADPVNYNRTLSNFIGYLMRNINNDQAHRILAKTIPEIKNILEFNDEKYAYLNINYGIYLMLETDEDPTQYFECILFDGGTTETPYVYAKINQALYVAKHDTSLALSLLDDIYYSIVQNSNVVSTKIFYNINRILVEYMSNKYNYELLTEIENNPLRGDIKYTKQLVSSYRYKFDKKTKFRPNDWKKFFLPGYIFYHGFNAELLLSNFASPRLSM